MNTTEYATMAEREKNYWWHVGRLRILDTFVSKCNKRSSQTKLLNVGCGTGGTIDMLERHGQVQNVDISDEAINFMRKRDYHKIDKVSGIKLPYRNKSFDIVAAFDVLEHIEEDVNALKEWGRVLKDDGVIVVSVPAYQWLWTEHDVSLHHKRRYSRASLEKAALDAGLTVKSSSYAIVFSLPLVVGFRYLNKLLGRKSDSETSYVDIPDPINKLFIEMLFWEAKLHKYVRFPAGTSVVTLLQKPPQD